MTLSIVYATALDDPSDYSDVGEGSEALASGSTGGQTGSGRPNKSQELASTLEAIALTAEPLRRSAFSRYAVRLRKCASLNGRRCEQPFCPRCQRRVAVRNRRQLEERLRTMDRTLLRVLRLSVAELEPRCGVVVLRGAFLVLRRTSMWRSAVIGGEAHFEIKAAGTSERWNVHLHALIELAATVLLSKELLATAWQKILKARGVAGSTYLKAVSNTGVVWRHMKPFSPLAYYTTKRQRGVELLELEYSQVATIVEAYRGLRLKCTFGAWRRRKRAEGGQ